MTGASVPPLTAYDEAAAAAAARIATLAVVEVGLEDRRGSAGFRSRFPERFASLSEGSGEAVTAELERRPRDSAVLLAAPVTFLAETAYVRLVRSVVLPRRNVKLVAVPPPSGPAGYHDDVGAMRRLPGLSVVVPADAPTVAGATGCLAEHVGPAYLRLPSADAPVVSDGTFRLGRAPELRSGTDLAIVALGVTVARALAVATDLARVGVSVRVLDAASVKPFDEAAVLRAARDTGGLLVAEAAPLATGLGTLVAAMTAENYPVPVRRVGLPDLWPSGEDPAALDACGLGVERLRDEVFELLRLRGKAT